MTTAWRRQRSTLGPKFLALVVALAPQFSTSHVAAMPLTSNSLSKQSFSLRRRDNGSGNATVPVQIWIPILIIGVVIAASSLVLCWRRSILARLVQIFRPANTASTNAQGTRQLTAEQLAGTINGTATPATGSGARRTRRPRRTPSQISTTSLPAYAKEPGEQELVIFRGLDDMEDAGMPPATVMMEPVSEDGEESLHSRNDSQSSQYPQIPATPVDEPLLQDDYTADLSVQHIQPPGEDMPRRSFDTLTSSEEASSLMRVDTNSPAYIDARGEAPPYFEAIDITPVSNSPGEASALPSPTSASPQPAPQRRSGFRTLLQSIPSRLSMHGSSHAPSHSRAASSLSFASSQNSHGRETSQSRASHRPTASSGSHISLSPFRTLSRQKSQNNVNLTSPSLISLNSISSPLTHTLTRTEFTYPKSGPTPEQLKFISSRESFARFGVPYGADAIAYAASTSRQDLDVPPPGFDTPPPPLADNYPRPGSPGPSRLRTASNAADLQRGTEASTSSSMASSEGLPTAAPQENFNSGSGLPAPTANSASTSSPLSHNVSTGLPSPSRPGAAEAAQIPLPASPKASEIASPNVADISSLVVQKPSTLSPSASGMGVPPTSFRSPSLLEVRSASRASSVAESFATAAESMASEDDKDDEMAIPTTPRMGAQHVLEPTDATIKQSPTAGAGPSQ